MEMVNENFGYCLFDEAMEAHIMREEEIKQELAVIETDPENSGLYLQYQPILDARTNRIYGYEALARLKSKKFGLIQPLEFIPIAEKTKLIVPVGREVILQAFRFLNKLKAYGYEDISVSINVSAIQLLRPDFNRVLFDMIDKMGVNPAKVVLEITETVFASDFQKINRIIGELKEAGIHIAIDDFGIGYSSLARERELNISCLKIDKYFIDKLTCLKSEEAITGDIISMAHKLGHIVIAEGIEHEMQKEYLIKHGCDKLQGFLISRPVNEDAAIELLRKY
jgi:EAL domain-containing protein (putative c-di-GMP-specific phosphodiesterase class I)